MFTIGIKTMQLILKNIKPFVKANGVANECTFSNGRVTYNDTKVTYQYPVLNDNNAHFTVGVKDLEAVLKVCGNNGVLELSVKDYKVSIDNGLSIVSIPTIPTAINNRDSVKGFTIELDKGLIDVIKSLKLCSAIGDIRYYLNGICFIVDETGVLVDLVATNGHCLGLFSNADATGAVTEYIVGTEAINFIINNNATSIVFEPQTEKNTSKRIQVNSSSGMLITTTIEGKYPDYIRVLPNRFDIKDISIDSQGLKSLGEFANKCMKVGKGGKVAAISFSIDNDQLKTANVVAEGEIELSNSTPITYPANSKYEGGYDNVMLLQSQYIAVFSKFFSLGGVDNVKVRTDKGTKLMAQVDYKLFFIVLPTRH